MKETRTEEVNRALSERRKLMNRRIFFGRILLAVWAVMAALNLVLLFGNIRYRLPLSCATADLLMMVRFLHPAQNITGWLIPLSVLLPIVLLLAMLFWKKHPAIRLGVFLLLWVDVICMVAAWLWDPVILFGNSGIRDFIAVANLFLHVFLIWHISRARRAVVSLETLPMTEYEGDPYEEFQNRRLERNE